MKAAATRNEKRTHAPRPVRPSRRGTTALCAALLPAAAWLLWPAPERPGPLVDPGLQRGQPAPAAANAPIGWSMPAPAAEIPPGDSASAAALVAAPLAAHPAPASAASADRAAEVADGDPVLFLTIVGDETHYHWGRAGDRPPRIDALAAAGAALMAAAPHDGLADTSGTPAVSSLDDPAGVVEKPYGPAPQECPRTLPAGSSQETADALRSQSGCRYLSSCSVEGQQCTWYYQGRG